MNLEEDAAQRQDNPSSGGTDTRRARFRFSLRTFLVAGLAFTLGFAIRNFISGLHPFAMELVLPSSTTAVAPGDLLIIDSNIGVSRRVRVLADGTIRMPLLGTVDLSGMDATTVSETLNASYAKHFKSPGVEVYRAEFTELIQ